MKLKRLSISCTPWNFNNSSFRSSQSVRSTLMKWHATKQDTARHSRVCWRDTSVKHSFDRLYGVAVRSECLRFPAGIWSTSFDRLYGVAVRSECLRFPARIWSASFDRLYGVAVRSECLRFPARIWDFSKPVTCIGVSRRRRRVLFFVSSHDLSQYFHIQITKNLAQSLFYEISDSVTWLTPC